MGGYHEYGSVGSIAVKSSSLPSEKGESKSDTLASSLSNRPRPTLPDVLSSLRVAHSEEILPAFEKHVEKVLTNLKHNENSIDDVAFIYQAYAATRELPEDSPLYSFARSLDSFDTFLTHYVPNPEPVQFVLGRLMNSFIEARLHPKAVFRINPKKPTTDREQIEGDIPDVYEMSGQWIRLEGRDPWSKDTYYVKKEVIEEIVSLLEQGFTGSQLYHATSSLALPSIGDNHALLSATKAREKEIVVKSGVGSRSKKYGSANVMAYKHALAYGSYSTLEWFDVFPVGFGISSSPVIGEKMPLTPRPWIAYPNDILLGEEVSLDYIPTIYTYAANKKEMQEWASVYAPHANVVSIEALDFILNNYFPTEKLTPEQKLTYWRSQAAKIPEEIKTS